MLKIILFKTTVLSAVLLLIFISYFAQGVSSYFVFENPYLNMLTNIFINFLYIYIKLSSLIISSSFPSVDVRTYNIFCYFNMLLLEIFS